MEQKTKDLIAGSCVLGLSLVLTYLAVRIILSATQEEAPSASVDEGAK